MANNEPKPGGASRRAGTRAVTRGGGGVVTDPQALVRQSLEAAGVDVTALLGVLKGTQGIFSVPQNPQKSRSLNMNAGALLGLAPDLQQAIERDPVKAPVAMRRVQGALLVLAQALALYSLQGTVPAAEDAEEVPDDNDLDEGQRAS